MKDPPNSVKHKSLETKYGSFIYIYIYKILNMKVIYIYITFHFQVLYTYKTFHSPDFPGDLD